MKLFTQIKMKDILPKALLLVIAMSRSSNMSILDLSNRSAISAIIFEPPAEKRSLYFEFYGRRGADWPEIPNVVLVALRFSSSSAKYITVLKYNSLIAVKDW